MRRRSKHSAFHWSYLHCNHIGILRWIVPDNRRPNCSDSWTVFCYFHDRKYDYEENKDECSVHCSWKCFVRNWHNLSHSLNNTDLSWSRRIISRLGYWSLVRSIFRGVHPWHKMPVGSNTTQNFYQLNSLINLLIMTSLSMEIKIIKLEEKIAQFSGTIMGNRVLNVDVESCNVLL